MPRLIEEGGIDPNGSRDHRNAERPDRLRPRPRRFGGHRRDHLVHQHVKSRGDGRCRSARAQRRRARPDAAGLRQDIAGARDRASSPITSSARACSARSSSCVSTWWAMAARPASATADRFPRMSRSASTKRIWPSRPCSAATGTSRAASIPRSRPHTSRRRRSSSHMRSRDTSTSTSPPTRSATTATGNPCSCRTSGRAPTR